MAVKLVAVLLWWILTDVKGARRLLAFKLKYEEVAGLTVMA